MDPFDTLSMGMRRECVFLIQNPFQRALAEIRKAYLFS
jgi:hypothetical protein